MGRMCTLSEIQKAQINVLSNKLFLFSVIVRDIKRSKKVISNFFQDPVTYGIKKSTGCPPKQSPAARWRVLREASRKGINSRNLQGSIDLNVTLKRVRQILNSPKEFVYKKENNNTSIKKDTHEKTR